MPEKTGRTGIAGNATTYHRIDIATSKPELLQPGASRPRRDSGGVTASVPEWEKGKFHHKEKGPIKKY